MVLFLYLVQSGGHNRPMTAIMTNSDAEKQGETILRHGASLMDSIRGKKWTWGKSAATENRENCDNISGIADTAKIRKFIRPNDNWISNFTQSPKSYRAILFDFELLNCILK